MKIIIYCYGKPNETYISEGVQLFTKRIQHYYPIEWQILATPKNANTLSIQDYKRKESESILQKIEKDDYIICLDENGKMLSSPGLGKLLIKATNQSPKRLLFVIGGAYGIDTLVLQRANFVWSLSELVFPHQLVRLLLAEQIYRACSINNNEKYHH